jgi:AcrR family transcriptional regulator
MPAGNVLVGSYWRQLAELNWHKFFYEEGAEGVPFFLELKERIRAEFSPDFLLIDARTGITEIGGVATTLLPDLVVCLLLNNEENLQGAREVLRSVKRAAGRLKRTIRIVPVLSRLPEFRRSPSQIEQHLTRHVHTFLCEETGDLATALDLPSIFVLHAEESLAIHEGLRVGGAKSVDESPLLRDYLRLFAQIIPSEHVEPHLDRLIDAAMKDMVERPDRVQSDLEALAIYCPHPKSYLALLKFYRLRNQGPAQMMQTATKFWELSGSSSHPLLWEIVRDHFRPERGMARKNSDPSRTSEMVEAVWIASGNEEPKIGLKLIDQYYWSSKEDRARSIVFRLLDAGDAGEDVAVECINRVIDAKDYPTAERLIDRWAARLAESSDFQASWASLIVSKNDASGAKEFFERREIRPASILAKMPVIYSRLLMLAGRREELEATLHNSLDHVLAGGGLEGILDFYGVFASAGKAKEFRDMVKKMLPPNRADQILSLLPGQARLQSSRMPTRRGGDDIADRF